MFLIFSGDANYQNELPEEITEALAKNPHSPITFEVKETEQENSQENQTSDSNDKNYVSQIAILDTTTKNEANYENTSESPKNMSDLENLDKSPRKIQEEQVNVTRNISETYKEYELPYGWKKIGHRRNIVNKRPRWDFYIISPSGRKFRSTLELTRYLAENPKLSFFVTDDMHFTDQQGHNLTIERWIAKKKTADG